MYGIIITFGILICLVLGERLTKKQGMDVDIFWGVALCALIGGVVGARLYHVIDYSNYYFTQPIRILYIHQGGLGIFGAIFGALLTISVYLHLKKEPLLKWLDLASVLVPLGQAIGRWGNFANLELFGLPTHLPWGLYIPPHLRPEMYINNDMFHPLFLYESIMSLVVFVVLYGAYTRRNAIMSIGMTPTYFKGFFTMTYIICYGVIRFSLEFLRIDSWKISGFNVAQVISVMLIVGGIIGLIKLRRKSKV